MNKLTKVTSLLVFVLGSFGVYSNAQEAPQTLTSHVLKASYFDIRSAQTFAQCTTAFCKATASMFVESIKCPGVVGSTCTYQIIIQSENTVAANDGAAGEAGAYQFLVDNAPPKAGGTDASGFYIWTEFGPGNGPIVGTSAAVTATVMNTVANQVHSIAVNHGCIEVLGVNGCFAVSYLANLQIAVLTP